MTNTPIRRGGRRSPAMTDLRGPEDDRVTYAVDERRTRKGWAKVREITRHADGLIRSELIVCYTRTEGTAQRVALALAYYEQHRRTAALFGTWEEAPGDAVEP